MDKKRIFFTFVVLLVIVAVLIGCNGKKNTDQVSNNATQPAIKPTEAIQSTGTGIKPTALILPTRVNPPTLVPTQTILKPTLPLPEVNLKSPEPEKPANLQPVEDLVKNNSEFALDLYRAITAGNKDNLFFSPLSV